MFDWYRRLLGMTCLLCLVVIVLGAYVRLSDAGLGCPDWPGCYGEFLVPDDAAVADAKKEEYGDAWRELEPGKAWREMIHRYFATTLGFFILLIAGLSWLNRKDESQPVKLPLILLAVVCFQGALGAWTVTLLLKPLIVMGHLLGGLTTLSIAFWLWLDAREKTREGRVAIHRQFSTLALVGLAVLACQIALGGWTSSNYAALACPDLPTCNGQWWPEDADFSEGFVMWRGLGVNYEFGVLDAPARVAIHYTHRLGAIVTFLLLMLIAHNALRSGDSRQRQASFPVLIALVAQVSIGLGVVWFGLPLSLATMHNGVAALLLLSMINLNHVISLPRRPA